MSENLKVAIVGATGLVGSTVLKVLEERKLSKFDYTLFSSVKSAGKILTLFGKEHSVKELKEDSFDEGFFAAIFSAGGATSAKFAPIAANKGCVVIDNSSTFRMDPDVPLIVPEVNPEDIKLNKGIIANPNCSTIQAMLPLKALHDKYTLKRVVYSTYQAVSGAGISGVDDLKNGINGTPTVLKFPHPIASNCLPHIDIFLDNGYTKEEIKMINETRKILHLPDLAVTATTVRVPVFNGHSESINIEFEKDFDICDLTKVLADFPNIIVEDDPSKNIYPLASLADGKDEVFVGRIRRDFSVPCGINIWVVADNLRKGAATNAVQILMLL